MINNNNHEKVKYKVTDEEEWHTYSRKGNEEPHSAYKLHLGIESTRYEEFLNIIKEILIEAIESNTIWGFKFPIDLAAEIDKTNNCRKVMKEYTRYKSIVDKSIENKNPRLKEIIEPFKILLKKHTELLKNQQSKKSIQEILEDFDIVISKYKSEFEQRKRLFGSNPFTIYLLKDVKDNNLQLARLCLRLENVLAKLPKSKNLSLADIILLYCPHITIRSTRKKEEDDQYINVADASTLELQQLRYSCLTSLTYRTLIESIKQNYNPIIPYLRDGDLNSNLLFFTASRLKTILIPINNKLDRINFIIEAFSEILQRTPYLLEIEPYYKIKNNWSDFFKRKDVELTDNQLRHIKILQNEFLNLLKHATPNELADINKLISNIV